MGSGLLTYKQLLEKHDQIKGRKIILLYCCYSGQLIETLKKHPNRQNYGVFVSADLDKMAEKGNDMSIDDQIWFAVQDGKKLSEIHLDAYVTDDPLIETQKPDKKLFFDTVL